MTIEKQIESMGQLLYYNCPDCGAQRRAGLVHNCAGKAVCGNYVDETSSSPANGVCAGCGKPIFCFIGVAATYCPLCQDIAKAQIPPVSILEIEERLKAVEREIEGDSEITRFHHMAAIEKIMNIVRRHLLAAPLPLPKCKDCGHPMNKAPSGGFICSECPPF